MHGVIAPHAWSVSPAFLCREQNLRSEFVLRMACAQSETSTVTADVTSVQAMHADEKCHLLQGLNVSARIFHHQVALRCVDCHTAEQMPVRGRSDTPYEAANSLQTTRLCALGGAKESASADLVTAMR